MAKYELSGVQAKNLKILIQESTCKVKDVAFFTGVLKALDSPIGEGGGKTGKDES